MIFDRKYADSPPKIASTIANSVSNKFIVVNIGFVHEFIFQTMKENDGRQEFGFQQEMRTSWNSGWKG
jgi:hypothetical protein